MGYELQVFRGGDPEDERTFEPLDEERVREALRALEGAGDAGGEVVVPREPFTASIVLAPDADGTLRSVYVSVDAHDAPLADRRREFRQLLELLAGIAVGIGARLYDRQLRRSLEDEAALDEATSAFTPDSHAH